MSAVPVSWSADQVHIETDKTLETTGGHLWEAAVRLFAFIGNQQEVYQFGRNDLRLLELGSGTGWLGIALALNLPKLESITLTEQACGGALGYLQDNVSKHVHLLSRPDVIATAALDWTKPLDSELLKACGEGALIFGSDLLYNSDGVDMLPKVMAAFCASGASILYAHTLNRYEFLDADFFFALRRQNLLTRELWADVDTPPEHTHSDERFCNAFPDSRVAILDIRMISTSRASLSGSQTLTQNRVIVVDSIENDVRTNPLREEIVLYLAGRIDQSACANLHTSSWKSAYRDILPHDFLYKGGIEIMMANLWMEKFQSPTHLTIAARDTFGQMLGFVHMDLAEEHYHHEKGFYLDNIHVVSAGQGLGFRLFQTLVRRLSLIQAESFDCAHTGEEHTQKTANSGVRHTSSQNDRPVKLWLKVFETNTAAIRTYKRWGGVISNERLKFSDQKLGKMFADNSSTNTLSSDPLVLILFWADARSVLH